MEMIQKLFIVSCFVVGNICVQHVDSTDIDSRTLTINCSIPLPKSQPKSVENLILNCSSDIIYSQFLKLLNITSLRSLTLNIIPSSEDTNKSINSTQFENLNVERLTIDYEYFNRSNKEVLMPMSSNVIYVLDTVREFEIFGINVLPGNEILKYNHTKCANLISLTITASNVRDIPSNWLEQCKKLISIHVSRLRQRNGTKAIRRKLLSGLSSLRTLQIQNCYIEELEDELADLVNLEKLDAAHNQIHYALTTVVLPSLIELDLSDNHIFSSALLSSGVEKQPKLRYLSLAYNKVLNICDQLTSRTTVDETPTWHKPLEGRSLNLPTIERFSLRGTVTEHMCFANMRMDSLENFDLSDSKISFFHFKALPMSKMRRLEVNVSGCPIKQIPGESFTEEHYKLLHHEELRVTGLNVTLNCDCDEYIWLARAVRERRLILSGAVCAGGQDLATISDDRLQCTKYLCGACTCRRFWQDNSTDVECSGELHTIPKEVGLRRLYASGNLVENITAADLPKSLIYLDLSKNHIARMSEEATAELFSVENRRMRFFGNPIICDCENRPFILGLMDHYSVVEDYNSLTCIDDNRFIREVLPDELCVATSRAFVTATVAFVASLVAATALLVALYYRYGKTAKVYLYSKGLCLFCIREEEIDADRPFDAFVSFSHKDANFVVNDLLPGLENEPYKYKICVHYRNWIAGELIPTQINTSVDKSRRTIIVLSKNFLESVWGLLEFRTAHLSALKEGRARLIIIILDDVLETGDLDGELKSYLRTNTYVKWGDPWFWDKVRYALPHKNIVVQDQNQTDNSEQIETAEIDIGQLDTAELDPKSPNTAKNREQQKVEIKNIPQKPIRKDLDDSGLQSTTSTSKVAHVDTEHTDSAHGDSEEVTSAQLSNISDIDKDLLKTSRNNDAISTDSAIEMERYSS